MTATYDSRGELLDRCGGYELVRWNRRRYVERMEELWERKCLLGLVDERLTQKILPSTRRRYICGEQFLLGELFLYILTICRTEDVYIHASPPPSRWRNYLPLFTQAAELDLFFLLLFFFFVPSLLVPFDFPLSSAAARLT